ncbi:hypothetical protein D9M72_394260 [compost metagenome]
MRLPCASTRLRQVSENGFQLMRRSGCGAGETGMRPDTSRPATAITTHTAPTYIGPTMAPPCCSPASSPPISVPIRIATKVPISTIPLPPTSSLSSRCCGR